VKSRIAWLAVASVGSSGRFGSTQGAVTMPQLTTRRLRASVRRRRHWVEDTGMRAWPRKLIAVHAGAGLLLAMVVGLALAINHLPDWEWTNVRDILGPPAPLMGRADRAQSRARDRSRRPWMVRASP
jgi:hypothetical protein